MVKWHVSPCFNGHFPSEPGLADIIEAKDDGGGGDNWTTGAIIRAKLQSNHHHQQINIQFFYRPDALPVTLPTVSKHWRERWNDTSKAEKNDEWWYYISSTSPVSTCYWNNIAVSPFIIFATFLMCHFTIVSCSVNCRYFTFIFAFLVYQHFTVTHLYPYTMLT